MLSVEKLTNYLNTFEAINRYYIAYSGGLDSHVLLHSLASANYQNLTAIHINHNLSPNAKKWEQHCKDVCKNLKVTFNVIKVDAKPEAGISPEAKAREARYAAFREIINTNDALLTAHHEDDQAETVLLRLFRGSGPKGLAAMKKQSDFGEGLLLRPLLDVTRDELRNYAIENNLKWIEDETNFDTSFDRNFVRHKLVPLIRQRWPAYSTTLSRGAKLCGQADDLLMTVAAEQLPDLVGSVENTLAISKLNQLEPVAQANLLRYWLQQLGLPLPSQIKLTHIIKDMFSAKADANPIVTWAGGEMRRYRDNLYAFLPLEYVDPSSKINWDLSKALPLPANLGILQAEAKQGAGIYLPDEKNITIRFRSHGIRFHPAGRSGSHPLKKLFQEWDVPPWQRDRIPMLFCGETLISVLGFSISEGFVASPEQSGWLIKTKP